MSADDIVKFLDTELYTLVFLATLFVVLLSEFRWPRRRDKSPLGDRWRTNFLLYFVNLLTIYMVFPVSAVAVSLLAVEANIGFFQWLQTPYLPAFVLGILVMDCTKYLQHYLMHRIPLLWRFHRAHHSDTACDVTTSMRFHPGEALLSGAVDLLVILAFGIPPLAVACYRVARIGISTLVHGNIGLGAWLEPKLRAFIVTPDVHRVHHSCVMRETNSNYSGGLIWWDWLFGTYCPQPEGGHAAMRIGIDGYPVQRAHSLRLTLTDPFATTDRTP
jgi:sterol desaturase/sphingolipid hydroxylase (fatty acid hydroxylase superfamily)